MTRTFAVIASLPLLVAACGSAKSVNAPVSYPALISSNVVAASPAASRGQAANEIPPLPLRAPGDFAVFRFSGKLKKQPLVLTERLVSQQDDSTVIDYTLEDGATRQTMRVRMVGEGVEQKVVSAAWVDGTIEGPVSTAAFDAFLARTIVMPESNAGPQSTEQATVKIDSRALDCKKTTYKITLAKRDATMSVLESESFAWGDLGGEIHAADGTLLYKAELIGLGNATSAESVVAQTSP